MLIFFYVDTKRNQLGDYPQGTQFNNHYLPDSTNEYSTIVRICQ